MWKCVQADVGAEPPNIANVVVAAQGQAAGSPPCGNRTIDGQVPTRHPRTPKAPRGAPSGLRFWRELGRLRRMRVDLARRQIRRRAVGQVLLADLGPDEHTVVRSERAEVVRALPADPRLRADVDRRRAGLLVGPAVPVRML